MKNMQTLTKQNNGQITESLKVIELRLKKNLAAMKKIAEQAIEEATRDIRLEIGKDLLKARVIVPRGDWGNWLEFVFNLPHSTARSYMVYAEHKLNASKSRHHSIDRMGITDVLREQNPAQALPRQRVDEQPIRNIVDEIDNKVFAERQKNETKERRLQKAMALELVEAGFRAMSHKLHSDKGGSDDAMRRLDQVRKTLKQAIQDEEVRF